MFSKPLFNRRISPIWAIVTILAYVVVYMATSGMVFAHEYAIKAELEEQDFDASQPEKTIEKKLKQLCESNKLPGMVAGYQRAGKKMVSAAFGVRKSGSDAKITVDDQLHLGSCTKAMTATLIGKLVERDLLSWDTTIKQGLPELSKGFDEKYHDVTIKQLLMHRGGVRANARSWHAYKDKPTLTDTRKAIVTAALSKTTGPKVGDYEYSNLGYVVASLMATKATGKPWETMMEEEVFQPLGIKSFGFGPPGTKGETDQPWGHTVVGVLVPIQGDNAPALGPAGTVHMSIADWANFCEQHLPATDDDQANVRLVSNETLKVIQTPPEDMSDAGKDYACGWMKLQRSWGGEVITHGGSNTMWMATVWISKRDRTMFFSICNCSPARSGVPVDSAFGTLIRLEAETRK